MNDYVVSLIRTWVPVAVGAALTWLATEAGIVLDDDTSATATAAAVAVVTAAYYAAARAIEQKWPKVGRIMLALGLTGARTPAYQPTTPATPAPQPTPQPPPTT
ncbi:hypothetical protein [Actinomadura rugatobispora]|uniref:Holin n=1 Tax=Actinomadura rugatobispora TaxID=1994 RepID=A0ABW1A1Z7_9ACTN|nr:hypothetical protein GCM10010200_055850 [Actinomadura rugatobispora]